MVWLKMTDTEQFLQQSQHEAQQLAQDISIKTGFKIDFDDPSIIALIAQRRWLESFHDQQIKQSTATAKSVWQNLNPLVTEMKSLSENIKTSEQALAEKVAYLKKENEILKSFREEIVVYFTSKANDEVKPFVAEIVKDELSGSLNTLKLKTNLVLGFVLILQVVILLVFLLK